MPATCIHPWCARPDHDENPEVHETAPAFVRGVDHPGFPGTLISVQLSYRDGDREPTLFLGDGELTGHATAELIDVLQRRLQQMRTVRPVAQAAAR